MGMFPRSKTGMGWGWLASLSSMIAPCQCGKTNVKAQGNRQHRRRRTNRRRAEAVVGGAVGTAAALSGTDTGGVGGFTTSRN
jgi:hypothetical protein